jgi:prolyl-tRNA editing enzyme YbaK/EbsC (Cys-tRNA(Pro) deacylase)
VILPPSWRPRANSFSRAIVRHPNIERVQAALAAMGSAACVRELPDSTRTSAEAAGAIGVEVAQIAKSLVFLADRDPVMVVASGADRVDTAKLSAALGGARITRADADTVRAATGYPIGGVSPAGLGGSVAVMVDRALAGLGEVWAAAGTPNAVFPTTFDELLRMSAGRPVDVAAG